jgi:DNA-binding NarL/FixJ family response regulator
VQERVRVFVYASDPITGAGMAAQLRGRAEVHLVDGVSPDEADVAVVHVDAVDDEALRAVRALQRNGLPRVVLVARALEDREVFLAVEAGVVGLLRRNDASPDRLVALVRSAASGEGTMPPDLLGRLLRQVRDVQTNLLEPRGLNFSGLSDRELDVLRLVADGFDTREIASELAYSERTIKNLIQDVTRRFGLRNRSHAVAYALRRGLI